MSHGKKRVQFNLSRPTEEKRVSFKLSSTLSAKTTTSGFFCELRVCEEEKKEEALSSDSFLSFRIVLSCDSRGQEKNLEIE